MSRSPLPLCQKRPNHASMCVCVRYEGGRKTLHLYDVDNFAQRKKKRKLSHTPCCAVAMMMICVQQTKPKSWRPGSRRGKKRNKRRGRGLFGYVVGFSLSFSCRRHELEFEMPEAPRLIRVELTWLHIDLGAAHRAPAPTQIGVQRVKQTIRTKKVSW